MKRKFLFLVVAFFGLFCAVAEDAAQFYTSAIQPFIDSGECPGVVAIFHRPGKTEVACLGYADVDKKIPMSLDRTFMQCSQTKGFCGITIAILVEEGKLSLKDPVSKYLPEFADLKVLRKDKDGNEEIVPAKKVLTVAMVMNHTGGFPFEVKKSWPQLPLREVARLAASKPLLFEPGTSAKYSNTGIDIGAAVVEVVTGKPWEVFLKERVLDPLEMTDTTFNPTDEQLGRAMSLYVIEPGAPAKFKAFSPWMPLPHNGPTVHPSAGAGLWTTAADQLKFCRMLMNLGVGDNGARILSEKTMKKLICRPVGPRSDYSLGWYVDYSKGKIGHGGAFGTQYSINWKKKHLGIFAVQQQGGKPPWRELWNKAYDKFIDGQEENSGVDAYTGRTE